MENYAAKKKVENYAARMETLELWENNLKIDIHKMEISSCPDYLTWQKVAHLTQSPRQFRKFLVSTSSSFLMVMCGTERNRS